MNKVSPGSLSRKLSPKGLKRRHRSETRFRLYGVGTIVVVIAILVVLLGGIFLKGYPAFHKTQLALNVYFDPKIVRSDASLQHTNFDRVVHGSLKKQFPELKSFRDLQEVMGLFSTGTASALLAVVQKDPDVIGNSRQVWLLATDAVDQLIKRGEQNSKRLSDQQLLWLDKFRARAAIRKKFNARFFVSGDSREPELAGLGSAIVGSLFVVAITLILTFPLSVGAAVYLEEFAPRNIFIRFVELNISNLAAIPSIIFGLLALAIFLNIFHLPRSSSLVGGLTLAMMTMPTIILAARSSLQLVPESIREAAEGLGASNVQVVFQHLLPIAMPGIMTGTILGVARALGESAPLLMVGMVAFIVDVPRSPTDPATVLPVQIFNWARNPEQGFVENTAAAILVLLLFLAVINATAIILRKRYEHRW